MKVCLTVVAFLVLAEGALAHFGARPEGVNPFLFWKDKIPFCPEPSGKFPTSFYKIRRYESPYSDEPTQQELFEDVDTQTVESKEAYEWLAQLTPQVVEVVPGKVYQALFFALGYPTIFITPDDTLIWIDAPESAKSAQECIDAFRAIPAIGNKPIVALIYTIFHGDHIWGAAPIVNDPNNIGEVTIIAHSELIRESNLHDTFKGFKGARLKRMFGVPLEEPPHIHDGGVRRLRLEGPIFMTDPPTDLLYFQTPDVILSRTIGGLEVQFISVPGYTSDQILVWVPDWKVMNAADVFYSAMPNLYTLRGEPGRDVRSWARGTRKTASFNAEVITFCHAAPIYGVEEIRNTLETYADGIQFLHDQVVRYMTKGFPPDVIPSVVNLPETLASLPYFYERYGIEDTAIKGIFDFYVGWFSGLTEDLFPVDRFERGQRLINMVGRPIIQMEAAKAYNNREYEWALELASYLWRNDETDRFALDIRTDSMKRLAEIQKSVASRNFLLTAVAEDWDVIENIIDTDLQFLLLHTDGAMQNLQFHLNNQLVEGVNELLYVNLYNINTIYRLEIRNSILAYEAVDAEGSDAPALVVKDKCDYSDKADVVCWRFMLAGYFPWTSIPQEMVYNGSPQQVVDFFNYFDWEDERKGGYDPTPDDK